MSSLRWRTPCCHCFWSESRRSDSPNSSGAAPSRWNRGIFGQRRSLNLIILSFLTLFPSLWLFRSLHKVVGDHKVVKDPAPEFAPTIEKWSNEIRSSTKQKIPYVLIFTEKENFFTSPPTPTTYNYIKNVIETVQMYVKAWKAKSQNKLFLWFLDDSECIKVINIVKPDLVTYFKKEPKGEHKGDVCRGAALYLTGGYYFDVDLRAIAPVELLENVTFSASDAEFGYFNAYMVVAPRHDVIRDYLDIMLHYYLRLYGLLEGELREKFYNRLPTARQAYDNVKKGAKLGVWSLGAAIEYHQRSNQSLSYHYLNEVNYNEPEKQKRVYPNLEFQTGGSGCCCNYLVEDSEKKRPYFFSRFVGTKYCEIKNESQRNPSPPAGWSPMNEINLLGVTLVQLPS